MRTGIILFLLVCCAQLRNRACAREFPMTRYTAADGLPSNIVYDIYRDKKGYLWFATDKGIARYNGLKFEVFTTFNGLPDNEVFFFSEDHSGRLWLGTYNGELCYFRNDTFHTAHNTPELNTGLKCSFVRFIVEEKDSSITICFSEHRSFLNIKGKRSHIMNIPDPFAINQSIQYVEKLDENSYRITLPHDIIIIDTNSRVSVLRIGPRTSRDQKLRYLPNQGDRYFIENNSALKLRGETLGGYPLPGIDGGDVLRAYAHDSNVLIATLHGVFINGVQHLKGVVASSVTQDISGNYWIGTNTGAYKIYKDLTRCDVKNDLYKGAVIDARNVNGNLLFANDSGDLYRVDADTAICILSRLKKRAYGKPGFSVGCLITDDERYYLFYGREYLAAEKVLSGTPDISIYKCTGDGGFKSMYQINNVLYVQTRRRMYMVDRRKIRPGEEAEDIFQMVSDSMGINRIFCSAIDRNNDIWYSDRTGMYKVINDIGVLQERPWRIPMKHFGFYGPTLVGYTYDNQLLVCNEKNGMTTVDTIMSQNCIWDEFYRLDDSHVLISTNDRYRILTLHHGSGKKADISAVDIPFLPKGCEIIYADKKNCYFFKSGALTTVDIRMLTTGGPEVRAFFTDLKVGRERYPINEKVVLPYSLAGNISISYSVLSFDNSNIKCQYSVLKNADTIWRDIDGDIDLVNTRYGDYTVLLRARTTSEVVSSPISFQLSILRPFWATWWFLLLVTTAMCGIIVLFVRRRIAYVMSKREKEHNSKVKHLRSEFKAMNALMNPHFIFNTLNNVQSLINDSDKKAANEYLRVFADLVRQNMHNVSKELISLERELDLVNNYLFLENFRFGDQLRYTIIVADGVETSEIMVPPLLIQPLVENSIKHGIRQLRTGAGEVRVNIYEKADTVCIEVRDNGVGLMRDNNAQRISHESFGLENIKKRIEQLAIIQNQQITFHIADMVDENDNSRWTVATISLSC